MNNAASIESKHTASPVSGTRLDWKLALLALPLVFLWFRLLDNLRLEWATDPQYGYGWAVPILCLGLLIRRWHKLSHSTDGTQQLANSPPKSSLSFLVTLAFAALAFLYLPTHLLEGATPEWRPIQWLLAFETIGLTLSAIYLAGGWAALRRLAFPVCFFIVAIPWPTIIEQPVIQGLTRFNASMVVEVLGALGIPAAQHGNLIEVGTGTVGLEDACSGIRSFQSSFMISLFLGEYYWLSRPRRWLLVPVSFTLAIAFNVVRTSILTYIAAKKGVAAIETYHDATGMTILLACFASTWTVAALLNRKPPADPAPQKAIKSPAPLNPTGLAGKDASVPATTSSPLGLFQFSNFRRHAIALIVWLAFVEIAVEFWYEFRESRLKPGPTWVVAFPDTNPTFKSLPIAEKTSYLLRFDDGQQGQWSESDGTTWQAFYFNWKPGRVAGYLAKRHEPEICMPAVGYTLRSGPELTMLDVHGVVLPVRSYVFDTPGGPLNVYQCRWEAGADQSAYVANDSARYNLIRAIWTGRGKNGQKVLEVTVSGITDPADAKQALVKELDSLIKLEGTQATAQAPARPTSRPAS